MLRRLYIRNHLLIEELDLQLDGGLTVITGETGSGKSILVGALGLAMGERAASGSARDPQVRSIVELEIDVAGLELRTWFDAHELPFDDRAILRRQLDPGGRSRAFINDTPVRVEVLRELGGRLVHVHSQHHTLLLNDPHFQLGLLDHLAGTSDRLPAYRERYAAWREAERELRSVVEEEGKARLEVDLLRFQLNELEMAKLRSGELEELTHELGRAEHAEEIQRALGHVHGSLTDDTGILHLLAVTRQQMARAARVDPAVASLLDRLSSSAVELKDIALESAGYAGAMEMDPARAERLRERSDELNRLLQKYRVNGVEELLMAQEAMATRLNAIGSLAERTTELHRTVEGLASEVRSMARTLSVARGKAIPPLMSGIEAILRDLGMPDARMGHDIRTTEPGPEGADALRLLFSANKDRAPATLDKVASGGELSRVMLALISLAADSQGLPTVVFDEIDTGVSGEVADRVGALMARMGADRQVLAITHLPQIASKGDHHLSVSKRTEGDRVSTNFVMLDSKARVRAIAQMLSGRDVSKQALENAKVLLGANK